jgi:quercetin dioxygenase-like cupin family protein
MKQALSITLFVVVLITNSMAQDGGIFPKGEKSPNNDHHVGTVYLKELNAPDSIFNYSIAVATFEPASYLFWHIHPGGQILLITEGTGYYQEKGKPKQTVRKGDVVKCQPGVEHWHGSTPQSGVTYLATSPAQKGKTIWLKPVTEQEYGSK